MKSVMTTTMSDSDMATTLHVNATSLRNSAESLFGIAHTDHQPGDLEFENLAGLAQTIERVAQMLDVFRANLCQKCKLTEVREVLVVKPYSSRKVG